MEHSIVTMEEMARELAVMRRRVQSLEAQMPRGTQRSAVDRHDHQELRGRPIADTAPSANQVLAWNATLKRWEPAAAGGGGGTAHVIQDDGVQVGTVQRANLDFRQGLRVSDDAAGNSSDINADWATTEIADIGTTESAGASTKVPRADHVHAGRYNDAEARTAVPTRIYQSF